MFLRDYGKRILNSFSAFAHDSHKFVAQVIETIESQNDEIRTTFAKRPCSATGGTA
jgi:hypothetical protein